MFRNIPTQPINLDQNYLMDEFSNARFLTNNEYTNCKVKYRDQAIHDTEQICYNFGIYVLAEQSLVKEDLDICSMY